MQQSGVGSLPLLLTEVLVLMVVYVRVYGLLNFPGAGAIYQIQVKFSSSSFQTWLYYS
jgi:hypothetical protein